MDIFVLTQIIEGHQIPVSAVSDRAQASAWCQGSEEHDMYVLPLDQTSHLGIGEGELQYRPKPITETFYPQMTGNTVADLRNLSQFLRGLGDKVKLVTDQALDVL